MSPASAKGAGDLLARGIAGARQTPHRAGAASGFSVWRERWVAPRAEVPQASKINNIDWRTDLSASIERKRLFGAVANPEGRPPRSRVPGRQVDTKRGASGRNSYSKPGREASPIDIDALARNLRSKARDVTNRSVYVIHRSGAAWAVTVCRRGRQDTTAAESLAAALRLSRRYANAGMIGYTAGSA